MSKFSSADIYADVNRRVLDELSKALESIESGAGWKSPWIGSSAPMNLQSGKPYRGVNRLLLSFAGYSDPRWTTGAAANKMGGKIRKGERTQLVTLWKRLKIKDPDAPDGEKVILILRYFRVLNVEQIDWPEGVLKPLPTTDAADGYDPVQEAEEVLHRYLTDAAIPLFRGGDQAYYDPTAHSITLPDDERFTSAPGYYGVAFHECAHSTREATGRERPPGGFGSDPYAREELVAEIASSLVCAQVGVEPNVQNSAKYIKGWMRAIADDEKLFVKAAGQAQKAADCILGITFEEPPSDVKPEEILNDSKEVVTA